jgi:DNA-binding transcriptional MerR regulator
MKGSYMRKKLIKSEVIQLFKTTKETLRYYEKAGLITPDIDENNYRYYDFKDLEKLRQIFFLRDIDLSIKEMQNIDRKLIDKDEYIALLEAHKESLDNKICHLLDVKNNIIQLINLEKDDSTDMIFQINHHEERQMYSYEDLESEIYTSVKAYYDNYIKLIQSEEYSERIFQMIYPFDDLGSGDKIDAKQCIELLRLSEGINQHGEAENFIKMPAGSYLSVYYSFEEGKFDGLPLVKSAIDDYLEVNSLKLMNPYIIEIEHPELSLFQNETSMIFELQVYI